MEHSHRYDDIIGLPHHVSETHPQLPMIDRAAQFSPFAALTGYGDAIDETARWTDEKRELTEEQQHFIGAKLHALKEREGLSPEIVATYYEPDTRKAGGEYRTVRGKVKRVHEHLGQLELLDGTRIPFDNLYSLVDAPVSEE